MARTVDDLVFGVDTDEASTNASIAASRAVRGDGARLVETALARLLARLRQ